MDPTLTSLGPAAIALFLVIKELIALAKHLAGRKARDDDASLGPMLAQLASAIDRMTDSLEDMSKLLTRIDVQQTELRREVRNSLRSAASNRPPLRVARDTAADDDDTDDE